MPSGPMPSTPPFTDDAGPATHGRATRDRERLLALEKEARAAAEIAVHRISTLQTVTAALSEAVTLAQVADITVGEGIAALGAQRGALLLFHAGRDPVELGASHGIAPGVAAQVAEVAAGPEASACPARDGAPVWARAPDEVRASFAEVARALAGPVAASPPAAIAAVPLSVAGRVAGVLLLVFDEAQAFLEEERFFALALVRHCAQAIERAQLYEAARRSNRRFELLARAGEIISSSIDHETTLVNVARAALPALGDFGFLDVVEAGSVRRVARAAEDSLAAQLDGARFAATARLGGSGLAVSSVASRSAIVISAATRSPIEASSSADSRRTACRCSPSR